MSSLFTDPDWRSRHSDLLQSLTSASQAAAASPSVGPCPLPASGTEARAYFDSYIREDHAQKPILSRAEIETLFNQIYDNSKNAPRQGLPRQTLYRACMIMALGAVKPFRHNACKHHPFGFYLTAMEYLDPTFLSSNLSAIQNLLLIVRFGIYFHIGASIWEIVRMCMRMCVEQGLHKKSPHGEFSPMEEQMRRRVFWCVYLMDRYSSSTLSRPFAISDHDIDVPSVVDADDAEIIAATQSQPGKPLDELDIGRHRLHNSAPSEASVLLLTVRLRQISSDVNTMFSSLLRRKVSDPDSYSALTATGRICEIMDAIVLRLEAWRSTAPVFEHPRSQYERSEWYDLLKTREIFNIMRGAVDASPKRDGVPPRHVLVQCLEWAMRTIELYSDLFERSIVTNTRSYFQLMINAGFSILYFASVSTPAMLTPDVAARCRDILSRCGKTLMQMTVDLANSRHYVAVFEALHHHLSHKLRIVQSRRPSPPGSRGGPNGGHLAHGHFAAPADNAHVQFPRAGGSDHSANGPQAFYASDKDGNEVVPSLGHYPNVEQATGSQNGAGPYGGFVPGLDNHLAWTNGRYLPLQDQYQQQPLAVAPRAADEAGAAYQLDDTSELLNWDFLHDEVLWNMGNYVYGGANEAFGSFDGIPMPP
ncbi:fungal-specific transcription factor domain-containing protein [Microdochium trichocladiopsis]|uniref:Fungal-specific transcription factor domain-containing protein n=1 Tax=Microdochium trichocladiopsis TaxID=1682393 RepID=A0A9P8YAC7_9PEZI|nr:fungal-specific transcription factor domain-containing protein [Microdochium trichocladiopsis]KAH7031694.1 fungal-specific transcription factor domain-containing protein [Microdochium trichocladiopsis]